MDLVPKNFSSLDKDVIENGSGTHSLPVLVGIAPGEKGKGVVRKDFARACEDFSHPENREYFPYANIEYDYIV